MQSDPFIHCPEYETDHFFLRKLALEDSEELFLCYSDPVAAKFFNGDNCGDDFFYTDFSKFKKCVVYWLGAMAMHDFLRLSVVDKKSGKCVGTIEMCPYYKYVVDQKRTGIFRVDMLSQFEKHVYLDEIYRVLIDNLYKDFDVDFLVTKAIPDAAERLRILNALSFENAASQCATPFDHYYIRQARGVAA